MIINRANLNALFTGYTTIFNQMFRDTPSDWERVAMLIPSGTTQEVYAWFGLTTRFREWLGDRQIQNLKTHDFTIKNISYENTVGVDRDNIMDDTYGVYRPMIAQLGMDAKTHPDELIFQLMKDGFTKVCYDGQFFFDTDHPVIDANGVAQSVSNHGGGAGTAWFLLDTTKAIRPFIFQKRQEYDFQALDQNRDENVFKRKEYLYGVDARVNAGYALWQLAYASKQTLDATNYAAARAAMMSLKGDHGKPLNIRSNLLLLPPSLEKAGLEVTKAERNASGATNVYQGTAELLVAPWLA